MLGFEVSGQCFVIFFSRAGAAKGAPRPRAAAHSVGAARGGRARARARDPRAGARDPSHAARPAARSRAGAGRPLGAAPGVSRGAGPAAHRSQPHMKSLTLDHASFWYPATASPALRDVSLEVAPGEVVALVGALGAGASTLLLVAVDLAPAPRAPMSATTSPGATSSDTS